MNKGVNIHIHPLFWFIVAAGLITGYFWELLMIFMIVIIHEAGHAVAATFFKWRIHKIELLPFGGVAEVEEYGNTPLYQEIIVFLAGPFTHVLMAVGSYGLLMTPWWSTTDYSTFMTHNLMLLCFNLLPVWPLDGGKVMFSLGSSIWPYRTAQKRCLFFSFFLLLLIGLIAFILFPNHVHWWAVFAFLLLSHYLEWKQQPYGFFRFLLERNDRILKKRLVPTNIQYMSRTDRLIDAAKKIQREKLTTFFIKEDGRKIPEEKIVKGVIEEQAGMQTLDTFFHSKGV